MKPLTPSAGANNFGYLVLLTNGIKNTTGVAAAPDTDYQTVRDQAISEIQAGARTPTCTPITNATLNAICKLTFAHLQIGAWSGSPASVVVSFSFSTQSTADTLAALTQIAASPAPVLTVAAVPNGVGGTLNTKNHQRCRASPTSTPAPCACLTTSPHRVRRIRSLPSIDSGQRQVHPLCLTWIRAAATSRGSILPAKTADLDIPIVVTVPNIATKPPTGWPVAIFQHGLTRNRTDALFMADAFAQAGFVVVSIDLPLHGLVPSNPLSPIFRQAGKELTFDLDVSNNSTLAPGPDGQIDGSGQNFVNLSSLLTTRDNLRQGAVDLLALTRALSGLDLNGDGTGMRHLSFRRPFAWQHRWRRVRDLRERCEDRLTPDDGRWSGTNDRRLTNVRPRNQQCADRAGTGTRHDAI